MALLFMDSFDHYAAADVLLKWTGGGISTLTSPGRLGGSAGRITNAQSNGLTKGLSAASGTTLVVGFGFRSANFGGSVNFFGVGEATALHAGLQANNDGSFSAVRLSASALGNPGTVLGTTAPGVISLNTWYHLQVKIVVHDTAGVVEVRLNGAATPVLSVTGVDTRNAATGVATQVVLSYASNAGGGTDYDDLWVCDTTGAAPWNTYLGDCRVDARFPNGAGSTTGWTPTPAVANYQNVDDPTPNGDTDYNSTLTIGATDTFAVQDVAVPGAPLYGVQVSMSAKKSDAGACTLAPMVAGVQGAAVAPATTYTYATVPYALNPNGNVPWTEAAFNAAEFGYVRVS
jgi:hypothetical protein